VSPCLVETRPRLQQRTEAHQLAGPAEPEGSGQLPLSPVEGDEAAFLDRPVDHDDLVIGMGVPDDLDLRVVLVGPEIRHRHVGIGRSTPGQQTAGGGRPLFRRVRPVFDADVRTEPLVEPTGQIAGHHDVVGRVQRGIGLHAVVDLEAGVGQPVRRRDHAYPDDDDIGGDERTVDQDHAAHQFASGRTLGGEPGHADPGADIDTVVDVQGGTGRSHAVTEDAGQGHRQRLDHGDLRTEAATGGGHLRPDESGPDDDEPGRLRDGGAESEAILQSAERVDTSEVCSVGKGAGVGSGGYHGAVERQAVPVVEHEGVSDHIQSGGNMPEPEIETESVDLLRVPQTDTVESPRPGQKLLRQRRAVIRLVGLRTDHDDPPAVTLGAQRLSGAQSGQRCAHHGDRRVCVEHHERPED